MQLNKNGLFPCCADLSNRNAPVAHEGREDLAVSTCKVCGRRHFELTVDPLEIGLAFSDLK